VKCRAKGLILVRLTIYDALSGFRTVDTELLIFMDEPPHNHHPPGGWWLQFRTRLLRYRRLLARYWWVLFFTTSTGLAIAAWVTFQEKAVFISTGRMMVSGRINIQEGAVFTEELANFFGTQVELMKSGEVRDRAVQRLAAMEPQLQPVPVGLWVSQLPQTSIFVLSCTGGEPQYTQKLLDAVMTEYIATKREMRSTKSENTQTAIMEEISRVEREVKQAEEDLLSFQKQNNVGYLEQEGNSAGSYLANLNRQLADLKTQYQLYDTLDIDQIIEKTENDPVKAGDATGRATEQSLVLPGLSQPQGEYLQAKQQLAVYKAERDGYAKVLRPKHPQIIELDQKISEQEALIASLRTQSLDELKSKRDSTKHQIDNLESVIKEWDTKALSLSQRLAEYNRIKGNLDRSKSLYDRLVNNLHDVDVTGNVDQDLVSVLERPSAAEPVKPGLVRELVLGVSIGLVIGLAILVLMDQMDERVGSVIDLQSGFGERVLAQIPNEKHRGRLKLLGENDSRHAFAEAFRALRSSLLYLPVEGERPKTLLIASAVPNEGKSTIASNLAITMALANVRVLLVDADLRRGDLHTLFECNREPGLSDLLSGKAAWQDLVFTTSCPNLDLIARGTSVANPGELFLGAEFDQFLRDIYDSYQYIIFDSSPLMASDDTTSLAPKVDAAIFAIRFSRSSTRISRKALELLRDRQVNVIGMVCNDVSQANQEYYYYKYPEYHTSKREAIS
jgi:polysaccharide biosynthesis transport protein